MWCLSWQELADRGGRNDNVTLLAWHPRECKPDKVGETCLLPPDWPSPRPCIQYHGPQPPAAQHYIHFKINLVRRYFWLCWRADVTGYFVPLTFPPARVNPAWVPGFCCAAEARRWRSNTAWPGNTLDIINTLLLPVSQTPVILSWYYILRKIWWPPRLAE